MSRIQKTIFPVFLFFIVFLSVSVRTTLGEESSDIDDKVHTFVDEEKTLRDEQEDTKVSNERIEISTPQTNIENFEEKDESLIKEEQKINDYSDNKETLINKNDEEINREIERTVMIKHLEELIWNLSEYMKKENKEQQIHEEIEQVPEKTEIETRNRLPKRHAISTGGCLLTEEIPAAVTLVSPTSSLETVTASESLSTSTSFSFPTPLPLEVLKQIECAAEAIEYGHSNLLSTIIHETLCEAKKLLHYLLHAFLNLLKEISIGPQINLLEADVGSSFVEFLDRAPVLVEELLKEPKHLLAIPEILKTAIPLEDIILTILKLKENLLLLLERIYPAFIQLFEKVVENTGKEIELFLSYVDAFKTFFLNLITPGVETLLSDVEIGPLFLNAVEAVYDGYEASGIQETFINTQPSSVTTLLEQDEILPVIPLSSETISLAPVITTSSSETEIVPIEEPLVPLVPELPSTVSTSSSTSTTTVVSEPEVLIEEVPSTITTTTTTTAAATAATGAVATTATATAATGAVATTAAASSSSSSQFSPILNIDSTNVVSSSSSSSSSTSSLSAVPELDETVVSTATSSSSSSSTLPEISKALFEPTFLTRVIPVISSISSGTKDLTSTASSVISTLKSGGNLLTDTTASSASTSSSSSTSLLSSVKPVISAVSPALTTSSTSSSASSSIIDNYAAPITRIKNIFPVTSTSSASTPSAVITSDNPTVIVPSSPILHPYRRTFQASSAVPVVTSLSATTSAAEPSEISVSRSSRFPWKLKSSVVLPRNKVIAAIGNKSLVPGDIILMTLKSNKTYFSRVTDTVSPITFEFLKPKMVPEVLNTFGRIWRIVPGDFSDVNCESLFYDIY